MKQYLAIALVAATASVGFSIFASGSANAREFRDHRFCQDLDPSCRDHRGPIIVVPPRPLPPVVGIPPVVVMDPPIGPRPPVEPPHHNWPNGPGHGQWHVQWDDNQDEYGISCREGRRIVKRNGFRSVQPIDCDGNVYRYNAISRRGARATVLVNMDGDIVRVNYWASLR
jgi:hypothetical protein